METNGCGDTSFKTQLCKALVKLKIAFHVGWIPLILVLGKLYEMIKIIITLMLMNSDI